MKTILVTGGAGFIGSHITDLLVEKKYKVIIYDNLEKQVHPSSKPPAYLNKKARFIKGDVRDYEKLKDAIKCADAVFHQAAMVGVGQSQYEIKKYTDVNVGGTANLLNAVVNTKNKIKKIIVASSMSNYGEGLSLCSKCGKVRPPSRSLKQLKQKKWELYCPKCRRKLSSIGITEKDECFAPSIYAQTKKMQEDMVLNIGKHYGIPSVALRYFNVFGPRQSLSNPYTGVAAIFLSRLKNNQRPVIFEDGGQTRDFIYVKDIARANLYALLKNKFDYKAVNVGSGNPVSVKDIALILARLLNKKINPEILLNFRKGDIRHCVADNSLLKKSGFKLKYDFEKGMRELIDWSRKEKAVDKFNIAQKELKRKKLIL